MPGRKMDFHYTLPAEMCECLVRLRHLMDFVAFADGVPLPLISFKDFGRERGLHRHAFAGIGKINDPAQRERVLAVDRKANAA